MRTRSSNKLAMASKKSSIEEWIKQILGRAVVTPNKKVRLDGYIL